MTALHNAMLGFATLLAVGTTGVGQQPVAAPRVVHVVAERFVFTPSNITMEEGTSIELRITSEDTSHGFKLSGPDNIDVEIPKRGRGGQRIVFTPSETGTYTFECSRVCGAGHGFMRGTIHVKPRSKARAGQ